MFRTALVFLLAAASAHAVPVIVQHHGRLLGSDNTPVTDTVEFVFTLHDVEVDPTVNPPPALWTRTYSLAVTEGQYSVALGAAGSGDDLDSALFDTTGLLYLQAKVNGQVMTPRLIVGSVPYAFFADRAAAAYDVDCAGCITPPMISAGANSGLDADELDGMDSAAFVHNTDVLQAGAKFSVASGAVAGGFTVGGTVGGAGFTGWDTDASDDLTVTAAFGGDVSGSYDALAVGDDSHAHGDATVADALSISNGRLHAPAGAGNVGIGTGSPRELLSLASGRIVVGQGAGDEAILEGGDGFGPQLKLLADDGAIKTHLTNGDSYFMGNVGIGTASPTQKLDVNGTVKATAFQGNGIVPAGAVMYFNLSACPTGWTELTAARGRYVVGLPSGGTLAGTAGTALSNQENRAVGQHTHGVTDPGHRHWISRGPYDDGNGSGSNNNGQYFGLWADAGSYNANDDNSSVGRFSLGASTGVTVDNAGSVAGTAAPYLQLLVCQKS